MKKKITHVSKEPIDPTRVRRIPPEGFSWIDRRFVREGFMESLPPGAILLYLFLVAVADAHGLSFYSDPTISRILKLDPEKISQARARLLSAQLILYSYPLYQVLPLPQKAGNPGGEPRREKSLRSSPAAEPKGGGNPVSIKDLLALAFAKAGENRDAGSQR